MAEEGRMGGWVLFAGVLMMLVGAWNAIEGLLIMIDPDGVSGMTGGYLLSQSNWGIVHLLFGIIIFLVGFGVLNLATWARMTAVVLVGLNLISRMFTIGANPWWSLIVIAMDIAIIYALCVYNDPMAP